MPSFILFMNWSWEFPSRGLWPYSLSFRDCVDFEFTSFRSFRRESLLSESFRAEASSPWV